MKHAVTYMTNLLCFCFLLILFTLLSCKKFVALEPPADRVVSATVFQSNETATAAVAGIYTQMMATSPFFSSGGMSIYAGLSADELLPNLPTLAETEFYTNRLQPGNGVVRLDFWLRLYKHIYQANSCLENLAAARTLSPGVKEALTGEALFLRAFCYFYLVNLFGDVPLVTGTDYRVNATLPRTPAQQVWAQITEDLKAAKEVLPQTAPSGKRVRADKWAAAALLARTYLYRQLWAEAEAEARAVIGSGKFSLVPDVNAVFLANSPEAIWQLAPVEEGFNTTEAIYLIPNTTITARPLYGITPQLKAAFAAGDLRASAWMATKTALGRSYTYPFKYKVKYSTPSVEYYTVLRYAEQLLIRAEARARQNKLEEARADLDSIRVRAGLAPTPVQDQASLLAAIEQERRLELFAEWGHRWLDLKRTGRLDAVLGAQKPTWQPYAALFPVPQSEILLNPALTQNGGYQ
ncbi:MAG TPA: RagB/SusD family nutrient uptake outer membrane protein [Flavisolibacter sp.]|jgi:hypothetical protein|nr:RagB/SusD family nutrient uptake outer membrane protein [Flavisolibacter sp.]